MIVNRAIFFWGEINILLDILSADFISYVAKIVTLCYVRGLYVWGLFDRIPCTTYDICINVTIKLLSYIIMQGNITDRYSCYGAYVRVSFCVFVF